LYNLCKNSVKYWHTLTLGQLGCRGLSGDVYSWKWREGEVLNLNEKSEQTIGEKLSTSSLQF
jgi:hypothetical protein